MMDFPIPKEKISRDELFDEISKLINLKSSEILQTKKPENYCETFLKGYISALIKVKEMLYWVDFKKHIPNFNPKSIIFNYEIDKALWEAGLKND